MSPFSSILRCFETCPHFHTLKKGQSQNYTPTDRVRKNAEILCISWHFSNLPDMFPFTRKLGCFECFLNDVYSVKPRKIAVLSIVSCQQNHALNVARLLQIDVKNPPDWAVRSREYINGFFIFKVAIFSTALVFGNRSMWLSLLIIWNRANLPTVSRLRSEETSPKSHPLDLRDFIHLVFRQIQILLFLLQ